MGRTRMIYTGQSSSSNDIYTMMRSEWESLRKEQRVSQTLSTSILSVLDYGGWPVYWIVPLAWRRHKKNYGRAGVAISDAVNRYHSLLVDILRQVQDNCADLLATSKILEELSLTKSPHDLKLYIGWERSIGFFRDGLHL